MSSPEKNLYLELELFLDPPETNPERLKDVLTQKKGEWNKRQNINPKYKSLVETANFFMSDGKLESLNLSGQASVAKRSRLERLNKDILVVEEDGLLEQVEYDTIIKRHKDYFSEKTIREKFTLQVEQPFQTPKRPHSISPKNEQEMNEIEDDLKVVQEGKCRNLYDLLDRISNTKTGDLLKRSHELSEINHKKPKGRAEVDAEARLLRKAVKFFENEDSRREYDLALKLRPFDALVKEKFEIRALKKGVTFEEYTKSIDETREIGFTKEEAEWYVYDFYCVKRKFPPPKRPVKSQNRWQCPLCFHLNDENAKRCKCGIPLHVQCPKCKHDATINDGACKHCGFPIRNMPNAVKLVEHARQRIAEKQIAEAEDLLRQANGFWRECPGMAEVRESINELKKQREKIHKQVIDLEKQIRIALAKHNIYEAHGLFRQLRLIPNAIVSMDAEEKRVTETLGEIQSQLSKLRATDIVAEKTAICENILDMAADCEEARVAFQKYPPLPPLNLRAELVMSGVELNWESPPSRQALAFLVIRKTGGVPTSRNDGDILAHEYVGTQFVDQEIETGAVYGYAVFTRRGQTVEHQGCRSEPVQKIDDVQNVNIVPGDGTLTFSWDEQRGCIETKVTRFESLADRDSGILIPLQQTSSFIDTKLQNGQVYHYHIQSVFKGIDGRPVMSQGRKYSAKPQAPPPPVTDLGAKRSQNDDFLLTWTPPSRGEVLLFDLPATSSVAVKPVEYTNVVDLKRRFGEPLEILKQVEGRTSWKSSTNGVRHIMPVTFMDGIAVFGRRIRLTNISEINNLQMQLSGTDLYLTWEWPKGLSKVLILYRHDRFPEGVNDAGSARHVYSRREYDLIHGFMLKDIGTLSYYFSIHAMVVDGEKNSCSFGVKLQTSKTVITYDLVIRRKFPFFGKRTAQIKLNIDSGEKRFPELVVKCDRGCPPLTREYGVPIMTIPPAEQTSRSVALDMAHFGEDMYMKIFLADPRLSQSFLLEGPLQHKLKLEIPRRSFIGRLGEMLGIIRPSCR